METTIDVFEDEKGLTDAFPNPNFLEVHNEEEFAITLLALEHTQLPFKVAAFKRFEGAYVFDGKEFQKDFSGYYEIMVIVRFFIEPHKNAVQDAFELRGHCDGLKDQIRKIPGETCDLEMHKALIIKFQEYSKLGCEPFEHSSVHNESLFEEVFWEQPTSEEISIADKS